jgi:hypothetical protein
MSSPLDRELGPDEPSPFAPKWVRDAAERKNKAQSASENPEQEKLPEPITPDERFVIEQYRVPRSLEPTLMPESLPAPRSSSKLGVTSLLVTSIAIAAGVAFLVVDKFSADRPVVANKDTSPSFSSRFSGQGSDALGQESNILGRRPVLRLNDTQGVPRASGVPFPLNVSLSGPATDATIVIDGLANGSTLNVGRASGVNGWRLSAADLGSALVQPPRTFIGPMDLVLELRLPDDSIADRRTLHLEWIGAPPRGSRLPMRQLDREEISDLLKRGEDFIANGDLASARLMLQRAAEAGDPRAALRLAGTYDPIILEQLSAPGIAVNANIAMARTWYERAKEFGSAEAMRRLEMLASRAR